MMYSLDGFDEVVFGVSDLSVSDFYESVAGWKIIHQGACDSRLNELWRLPTECKIEEIVLKCPTEDRGYLRLVRFEGCEQTSIRAGKSDIDPGGYFYTHVRTRNIEKKLQEIRDFGWSHTGELKEFDFDYFHVRECISRIHDDISFSVIQSFRPKIDIPQSTEFTSLFNVCQVVSDASEARKFYEEQLDFHVFIDSVWDGSEEGMTVLDVDKSRLPSNYRLKTLMVQPKGENIGSIEVMCHEGLDGQVPISNARPPNLGHITVRFPVKGLDSYFARLQSLRVNVLGPPAKIRREPFGDWKTFVVESPDGAWIEFYEPS